MDWGIPYYYQGLVYRQIIDCYKARIEMNIIPDVQIEIAQKQQAVDAQIQAFSTAIQPNRFLLPVMRFIGINKIRRIYW